MARRHYRGSLHADIRFIANTARISVDPSWFVTSVVQCPIHHHPLASGVVQLVYNNNSVFFDCRCVNNSSVFLGDFNLNYTYIANTRYLSDDARVQQYVKDALTRQIGNTKRDLLIRSAMGTGKTFLLDQISDLWPRARILCISCRRALAADLQQRLSGLGLRHYQEKDLNLECDQLRLVVQLDSLAKCVPVTCKPFDIVIFEESESLLAYCSSSTFSRERGSVYDSLQYVVSTCRTLIGLDADMSDRTMVFLYQLRRTATRVLIGNLATPLARRVHMYQQHDSFVQSILAQFTAGKNIAVVSNSKAKLRVYYDVLRNSFPTLVDAMMYYDGDSNKSDRETIPDCNNVWCTKRVVLWTPVISAGVNFSERHFDTMFLSVVNNSTCVREVLQMAGRIRQLIDGTVHVHLAQAKGKTAATGLDIATFGDYVQHLRETIDSENALFAHHALNDGARRSMQDFFFDLQHPMTRVILYNRWEIVKTTKDLAGQFLLTSKQHGDYIAPVPLVHRGDDNNNVSLQDLQDISDQAQLRLATAVAEAPRAHELDLRNEDAEFSTFTRMKEVLCRSLHLEDITNAQVVLEFSNCVDVSIRQFCTFALCSMMINHRNNYLKQIRLAVLEKPPTSYLDNFQFFVDVLKLVDKPTLKYFSSRAVEAAVEFLAIFNIELGSYPLKWHS